jgi:hypothetical protein
MISIGTSINRTRSFNGIMPEPPIMRRDVLQEDETFLLQEDGTSKLVISYGTFDSIVLEDGSTFLTQEDLGKLILTVY